MKEKRTKMTRKKVTRRAVFFDDDKRNYQIFAVALLVIIIGYYFLAQPPVSGFTSLTLAPLILIIGYCIFIPWAIFYRPKRKSSDRQST